MNKLKYAVWAGLMVTPLLAQSQVDKAAKALAQTDKTALAVGDQLIETQQELVLEKAKSKRDRALAQAVMEQQKFEAARKNFESASAELEAIKSAHLKQGYTWQEDQVTGELKQVKMQDIGKQISNAEKLESTKSLKEPKK